MSIGSTIRAGAAYVEVTAETSKLQRNLTSAQAQLQAFGKTCTTVGRDLLMLSGAMAVPLVMAAKSFAGFDDSMRLVQAVTQATDNDFKALTITSQRLGRETSYTAQQVADAMVALGRMISATFSASAIPIGFWRSTLKMCRCMSVSTLPAVFRSSALSPVKMWNASLPLTMVARLCSWNAG